MLLKDSNALLVKNEATCAQTVVQCLINALDINM